jgi:protein-S-isoprenylcysteine O-methyltransferase Ste14
MFVTAPAPGALRIIYELWEAWAASWVLASVWSARTAVRMPLGVTMAYQIPQFFGAVLLLAPVAQLWWPVAEPVRWAMAGLVAAGFAFCWWARLHLGRLWSGAVVRKEGHHIVDTGPYALVRHPIYTGLILSGFATAVARGGLVPLAGAGLIVVAWTIKARLEERLLRAELGAAAYDAYAQRTPMLVPFTRV